MSWLRDYTTFEGRLRRRQACARYAVVVFAATVVQVAIIFGVPWQRAAEIASSVLITVTFYPAYSIIVRRFHDVGVSGWWLTPVVAVGFFVTLALRTLPEERITAMLSASWFIAMLAAIVIAVLAALVWSGAEGENRFGPPPDTTALDRVIGKLIGMRLD